MKTFIKLVINIGAVYLASLIFPQNVFYSNIYSLIGVGVIIWLVNLIIRPVLKVLSIPVTVLTLGLFSLVINAWLVSLSFRVVDGVEINSFWISLLIAVIISLANAFIKNTKIYKKI